MRAMEPPSRSSHVSVALTTHGGRHTIGPLAPRASVKEQEDDEDGPVSARLVRYRLERARLLDSFITRARPGARTGQGRAVRLRRARLHQGAGHEVSRPAARAAVASAVWRRAALSRRRPCLRTDGGLPLRAVAGVG